jgi:aminodeoxyfutalosine deaminase
LTLTVYQARWILPISQPPIAGGWVAVKGGKVVGVGKANQVPPLPSKDLGDVAILPGLINAHTHLEFSDLEQPIGMPGVKLHDWIGEVVRRRKDAAASCVSDVIMHGLACSHDSGASLVADIATTPMPVIKDEKTTAPEVIFFAEVLGLIPERSNQKLNDAIKLTQNSQEHLSVRTGISPHAPYSTPLAVVQQCVEIARKFKLPLAMHVAESEEERQLIEQGDGPFAERLKAIQVFDPSLFPWGGDATLDLLKILSGAPLCLIVHGNDLRKPEIEFIARHPQMSVVYCPRTHAFFGHQKHPVAELMSSGIRVALGTDSLASNPDLSIWHEVQWLLKHRQDIAWQTTLAMATQHGADALGRKDLGRIEVGAQAKLLTIATNATHEDSIAESLVNGEPRWL